MTKKLCLHFITENNKIHELTIDHVNPKLTKSTIDEVVKELIETKVFDKNGLVLKGLKKAEYVEVTRTEIK